MKTTTLPGTWSLIRGMDDHELATLLESRGAVLKGHFVLSSGRHSDTYFEKFRILEQPDLLTAICERIAERFRESGAEIVAGPTTGGIIIAFEVARQMGLPALYFERVNERRVLRRGASLDAGMKVLIVDDVLTTGLSVAEVAEAISGLGGNVIGAGLLVDRSEADLNFPFPVFAAIRAEATSYAPDEVPEWLQKIPIQDPGTRRAN